ncbi:MAG: hypothetical protein J1E34_00210 [Oscillospiraceae bacterium]|nr:hypothetical protein [Oscillospiraceae bacterium]
MKQIISFFISVFFIVDMFFVGLCPSKTLVITQTGESAEFYVDSQSENGLLRLGVAGEHNLFEPGEEISVVIECLDEELYGKRARVSVKSEQADFNKRGYIVFSSEFPYSTFSFSSETNGIYTVSLNLTDRKNYSFSLGILPRNEQAGGDFFYGIQPYITRAYTWGEGFGIPNCSPEESVDKILDVVEYLGVNLVREDSVGWGAMQSEAFGEVDFSAQDFLINKVTGRGIKYNWLFGYNAGEWSVSDKYKEGYDESLGWTYPPNEELWLDFAAKTAQHYSKHPDILWEIWNEPNWDFFNGSDEEYFSLLEKTAAVLKDKNSDFYVYSGGLAVAEKESNLPFYRKSAELINKDLLNNFGYHNHDGLDNYYDYMAKMLELTGGAGLTGGGINSESGLRGAHAPTIACKALYTRSSGASGFVSFSFRKTVTPENDINDYAFFSETLQPYDAVIAYGTVIRFLGNARFIENISNEKDLIIDEYAEDGKTIRVYFSLGNKTKISAPDGSFEAYDMYGNQIKTGRKIKVTNKPIYLVFD